MHAVYKRVVVKGISWEDLTRFLSFDREKKTNYKTNFHYEYVFCLVNNVSPDRTYNIGYLYITVW